MRSQAHKARSIARGNRQSRAVSMLKSTPAAKVISGQTMSETNVKRILDSAKDPRGRPKCLGGRSDLGALFSWLNHWSLPEEVDLTRPRRIEFTTHGFRTTVIFERVP